MQKISTNIWFDNQAQDAADFYTSLFDDSRIIRTMLYGEAGQEIHGREPGSVMTVDFELDGFSFTALNGGPYFRPNPSISFFIQCRTVHETDSIWERLANGGKVLMPMQEYGFSPKYGWVEDRFGVSWQVNQAEGEFRQRIMPSLLFTRERCGMAREAIGFYTSVFRNAKAGNLYRYGPDQAPNTEGTIMYADFELEGQLFSAMDSASEHEFGFNEGISFIINCRDQAEVDYYWNALSAVPESEQCGWLKDRFGVSWQVVPTILYELMQDPDKARAERVNEAILAMKKIDIEVLKRAAGY